jgi:hypothetical protein
MNDSDDNLLVRDLFDLVDSSKKIQAAKLENQYTLGIPGKRNVTKIKTTLDLANAYATFQSNVYLWLEVCFEESVVFDKKERSMRFLEESIELVQALGLSKDKAHKLVDHVYSRPVGEVEQEIGGVMITLAALCIANTEHMHEAGMKELDRVWKNIELIREKQKLKPKFEETNNG